VRDPVCGMMVDPHATKHRAEHDGHPYYHARARARHGRGLRGQDGVPVARRSWLFLPHGRGGAAEPRANDAEAKKIAEKTVREQEKSIAELKSWLERHDTKAGSSRRSRRRQRRSPSSPASSGRSSASWRAAGPSGHLRDDPASPGCRRHGPGRPEERRRRGGEENRRKDRPVSCSRTVFSAIFFASASSPFFRPTWAMATAPW
jgi:hypothetical protein